jgi:phosphatidylglycerophosphatase A
MSDHEPQSVQVSTTGARSTRDGVVLWVSQGFGIGRIPFMPGTFGSVLGVGWFALLLAAGNVWVLAAGMVAGIGASVWLCGEGERILGKKDPGSVVMDEVTAIPVCFLGWLWMAPGPWPSVPALFEKHWGVVVLVFVLFRVFDIAKPWPVGRSQSLPGGWGITVDDVLAGVYVALITGMLFAWS